jgi:phosphoserine aminotransferase
MAMWNFLGPNRGVDIIVWDIFSAYWAQGLHSLIPGCVTETRLEASDDCHAVLPVIEGNPDRDLVLTWCGTTQGVWMGSEGRQALARRQGQGDGLVMADLASAVMTTDIPWHHLDVATFSWQKGLGGEAHLGVIVVGPRALERWEKQVPAWPIPRLYRLTDAQGQRITGPFHGQMIHTCSMLIVEEYALLLDIWRQRGGQASALETTASNVRVVETWLQQEPLFEWVISQDAWRAHGPLLVRPTAREFAGATVEQQWDLLHRMSRWLAGENIGFDILNHARAFPAIRLWCGPTVQTNDMKALLPWLQVAWQQALG